MADSEAETKPTTKSIVKTAFSDSHTITVEYKTNGGQTVKDEFRFLFVACRPGDLPALELTDKQQTIFDSQKYFTFQLSLFTFPVPQGDHAMVKFSPVHVEEMVGSMYGYRSETRKTFNGMHMDNLEVEYVTIYQLVDPERGSDDKEYLIKKLDTEMQQGEYESWFPYDWSKRKPVDQLHNPYRSRYFNHFHVDDVGYFWEILKLQGKNSTAFVHGSCCFESILHCYNYVNHVLESIKHRLPSKDKKILIVGAGPSGLLTARRLGKMGYTNITILEKFSNYSSDGKDVEAPYPMLCGKTQTYVKLQADRLVPCELGTCYLSPEYSEMMDDLDDLCYYCTAEEEKKRNDLVNLGESYKQGTPFRQITTKGQFSPDGIVMWLHYGRLKAREYLPVWLWQGVDGWLDKFLAVGMSEDKISSKDSFPAYIDSSLYFALKGLEEATNNWEEDGKEGFVGRLWKMVQEHGVLNAFPTMKADNVVKYCMDHYAIFEGKPFPTEQPKNLPHQTIYEYMTENDFCKPLWGIVQYAQSVQGYGTIDKNSTVPVFYLFLWLTPANVLASCDPDIRELAMNQLDSKILPNWGIDNSDSSKKPDFQIPTGNDMTGIKITRVLRRGWGDVWRQQKKKFAEGNQVEIVYDADITSIDINEKLTSKAKKGVVAAGGAVATAAGGAGVVIGAPVLAAGAVVGGLLAGIALAGAYAYSKYDSSNNKEAEKEKDDVIGPKLRRVENLKQRLETAEVKFGHDDLKVVKILFKLSSAYGKLEMFKEQREILERVLEIAKEKYGDDSHQYAITLRDLAIVYGKLGMLEEQRESLERVLEILRPLLENNRPELQPQVSTTSCRLARVYKKLGMLEEQQNLQKMLR